MLFRDLARMLIGRFRGLARGVDGELRGSARRLDGGLRRFARRYFCISAVDVRRQRGGLTFVSAKGNLVGGCLCGGHFILILWQWRVVSTLTGNTRAWPCVKHETNKFVSTIGSIPREGNTRACRSTKCP